MVQFFIIASSWIFYSFCAEELMKDVISVLLLALLATFSHVKADIKQTAAVSSAPQFDYDLKLLGGEYGCITYAAGGRLDTVNMTFSFNRDTYT